jgi:nitric oxide reductase large subunit
MRMPGDIVFSVGSLIMAWDFLVELRKAAPNVADRVEGAPAR